MITAPYRQELSRLQGVWRTKSEARISATGFVVTALLVVLTAIAHDIVQSLSHARLLELLDFTNDRSLPEVLGYVYSAVASVLLLLAFLRTRLRSYLLLSVAFAFALADDALQYHENVSRVLIRALHIPGVIGLRPQDVGEMVAWLLALAALIPVVRWCLRQREPRETGVYLVFGSLVLVLAVFAVGVDALHMMLGSFGVTERVPGAEHVLTWAEDGGELVTLALIAASAVLYHEGSLAIEERQTVAT